MNTSEAEGSLALNAKWLALDQLEYTSKAVGLHQNKVIASLAPIQRPGH